MAGEVMKSYERQHRTTSAKREGGGEGLRRRHYRWMNKIPVRQGFGGFFYKGEISGPGFGTGTVASSEVRWGTERSRLTDRLGINVISCGLGLLEVGQQQRDISERGNGTSLLLLAEGPGPCAAGRWGVSWTGCWVGVDLY